MRNIRNFALVALAVCSASAAAAQRSITFGQSFSGSLDTGDPTSRGAYYEQWTFTAQRGENVVIHMVSSDFDAFLSVGQRRSGDFVEITSDDDGGDGVNSRISFTAPNTGQYLVRATSLGRGSTGRYTISLDPRGGGARRPQISFDQTVSSRLDGNDRTERGSAYEEWSFFAQPGQAVHIRMASSEFDTFLSLGHFHSDGSFHELSTNDDSDGTNSVIEANISEGGEFIIRASAYRSGTGGNYTLQLRRVHGGGGGGGLSIGVGQTRTGFLDRNDRTADGKYYEDWTFTPASGGRVTINLVSQDFDPFLELWLMDGGNFHRITEDDDGGDGVNAQLVFTPMAGRQYVIRARAYAAGNTGGYTLSVY